MVLNISQLKKSGIIEEFEDIIESKTAIIKKNIRGIIVLTNSRFLFLTRASNLSKSYLVKAESGLLNIRTVSAIGLLKRDMIIQFKNLDTLKIRLRDAEYFAKKIQAIIVLCKKMCIRYKAEQLKIQYEQNKTLGERMNLLEKNQ